jgi:hypothetical protein
MCGVCEAVHDAGGIIVMEATWDLKVMEDEPPGKHELKTQFVELRTRGVSSVKRAKSLKVADGN